MAIGSGGSMERELVFKMRLEDSPESRNALNDTRKAVKDTGESLEDLRRKSHDASIRMGEGFKQASQGAMTLAKGVAFLSASTEEDFEKMVKSIARIQGAVDTLSGLVDTVKGLTQAWRAYGDMARSVAGSQTLLNNALAAGNTLGAGGGTLNLARGSGLAGELIGGGVSAAGGLGGGYLAGRMGRGAGGAVAAGAGSVVGGTAASIAAAVSGGLSGNLTAPGMSGGGTRAENVRWNTAEWMRERGIASTGSPLARGADLMNDPEAFGRFMGGGNAETFERAMYRYRGQMGHSVPDETLVAEAMGYPDIWGPAPSGGQPARGGRSAGRLGRFGRSAARNFSGTGAAFGALGGLYAAEQMEMGGWGTAGMVAGTTLAGAYAPAAIRGGGRLVGAGLGRAGAAIAGTAIGGKAIAAGGALLGKAGAVLGGAASLPVLGAMATGAALGEGFNYLRTGETAMGTGLEAWRTHRNNQATAEKITGLEQAQVQRRSMMVGTIQRVQQEGESQAFVRDARRERALYVAGEQAAAGKTGAEADMARNVAQRGVLDQGGARANAEVLKIEKELQQLRASGSTDANRIAQLEAQRVNALQRQQQLQSEITDNERERQQLLQQNLQTRKQEFETAKQTLQNLQQQVKAEQERMKGQAAGFNRLNPLEQRSARMLADKVQRDGIGSLTPEQLKRAEQLGLGGDKIDSERAKRADQQGFGKVAGAFGLDKDLRESQKGVSDFLKKEGVSSPAELNKKYEEAIRKAETELAQSGEKMVTSMTKLTDTIVRSFQAVQDLTTRVELLSAGQRSNTR